MPPAAGLYRIGTSGWAYPEWRQLGWYPPRLPPRQWLSFYAQRFPTVEVNSTFYRLHPPERFQQWAQSVPDTFCFAIKAPRALTHQQGRDPTQVLHAFLSSISALGQRLGPLLWQFPPRFSCDLAYLEAFLRTLPPAIEHAVEFRHPSWENPAVEDLLRAAAVALVWSSSLRYPRFRVRTAPFLYLRFHGLEGGYAHRYTDAELQPWAELVAESLRSGYRVYAYFNNTAGTAPYDAQRFQELVEKLL